MYMASPQIEPLPTGPISSGYLQIIKQPNNLVLKLGCNSKKTVDAMFITETMTHIWRL